MVRVHPRERCHRPRLHYAIAVHTLARTKSLHLLLVLLLLPQGRVQNLHRLPRLRSLHPMPKYLWQRSHLTTSTELVVAILRLVRVHIKHLLLSRNSNLTHMLPQFMSPHRVSHKHMPNRFSHDRNKWLKLEGQVGPIVLPSIIVDL
jgi:hypothetical protein